MILSLGKYLTNAQSDTTKKEVFQQGEIKFVVFDLNVEKYKVKTFEPLMK